MTRLRFYPFLLVGALAILAVGSAVHARGASAAWAARLGGFGAGGKMAAVAGAGGGEVSAPEADAPEADTPDWEADPESEYREQYLKKGEERRLIVALVFLGVVVLILMIWWSWGKLHHRRPRL